MASTEISSAVEQFIQDLTFSSVDQDLDNILQNALMAERQIRTLFASDPHNQQLRDRYLGLINVFSIHPSARRTRERRMRPYTTDIYDHYVFPVDPLHRRPDLMPSTVFSAEVFQQHWDVFTHGALSKMKDKDWNNVVAAGGSVLACLMQPYPKIDSPVDLNNYYQSDVYGSCDIDLFLWGLSPEQAEMKMLDIYSAVCAATHWPVICVRKANTVSIHTTWPARPIQIILRLYQSPAEILAGFDVDAPCCAYDGQEIKHVSPPFFDRSLGKKIWVNPRCLTALVRQTNTIDMTRRSPSYEMRLAKYGKRGFEIHIPSLRRQQVKASIYSENLWNLPNGLARLLVLEMAHYKPDNFIYLSHFLPKYNPAREAIPMGDELGFEELLRSNYDCDIGWAQIPYSRAWDAKRIQKMVAEKDKWMNSLYYGGLRGPAMPPHRHVFFAGTMQQCLRSFCRHCESLGELPADLDPGRYIKGPIKFMTINPGHQLLTGSFRPMDIGEWSSEAYGNENCSPRVGSPIFGLKSVRELLLGLLQLLP